MVLLVELFGENPPEPSTGGGRLVWPKTFWDLAEVLELLLLLLTGGLRWRKLHEEPQFRRSGKQIMEKLFSQNLQSLGLQVSSENVLGVGYQGPKTFSGGTWSPRGEIVYCSDP